MSAQEDADFRRLFGDTHVETAEDWYELCVQTPDKARTVPLGFNARCTTPQIDVAYGGRDCWVDANRYQTVRVRQRKDVRISE